MGEAMLELLMYLRGSGKLYNQSRCASALLFSLYGGMQAYRDVSWRLGGTRRRRSWKARCLRCRRSGRRFRRQLFEL